MVLEGQMIQPGQTGHEAGRQLLEKMYTDLTGSAMPPICIAPKGKPYFENNSVHFSITHTKHHVFCALSDRPVGIDAEETDRKISLLLAEKILSENEKKQYDRAEDKQKALLIFWVLKEAAAKCTGEGIHGYPNQTEFSLNDPRVTQRDGCLMAVVEQEK